MKKSILYSAASVLLLTGCNDFNDKLDGFSENNRFQDVKTLNYTLTDADYKTIAGLSANKSLALSMDPDGETISTLLAGLTNTKYFTDELSAADFIPAFLSNAYTTADDKSAIKVTYNKLVGTPEYLDVLSSCSSYKLSDEDYKSVWAENKVEASFLTPKTKSNISAILKQNNPDAKSGDMMLVNYSYSVTEPSISVGGSAEEEYNVWKALTVEFNDGSGFDFVENAIDLSAYAGKTVQIGFCYESDGTSNNTSTWEVKNVKIGTESAWLIDESFAESLGSFITEGKLPEGLPSVWNCKYNAAVASAYLSSEKKRFATQISLVSPEVALAAGSKLSFEQCYKFCNDPATYLTVCIRLIAPSASGSRATRAFTASYNASGIYQFDGSNWAEYSVDNVDVRAINPEVYNSLGVEYISSPETVLPVYASQYYPYAKDGDVIALAYYSSSKKAVQARELVKNGDSWTITSKVEAVTDQFVRTNGKWVYNPSVVITLPAVKGNELSTLYFQTATDWVWENVDQASGCTAKGQGYVTSYGNNEYYTGSSAYQCNADWRASKARDQFKGYSDNDEEVVAQMKKNFIEVMGHVLAKLHPEAVAISGVDVTYTINFVVYTGTSSNWTIVYKVVGNGQFEYVEDSLKEVE